MSNIEMNPVETVCENSAATLEIQILEPREVPLGGLRAMPVRRTLPQRQRSLIGAWCFFDHYGPEDVSLTGGMNVAAHPHIGLQTVSWLFSGEIEHRDSAGFHAYVRPGELNLMTAGHGISHSERSTPATTVLHGAQLWVVLPESARKMSKTFDHYAPPIREGDGWKAQVFLGSLLGEVSPVATHSALVGAEISIEAESEISITVDPTFEHGILLDAGDLSVIRSEADTGSATKIAVNELAYVPPAVNVIRLRAGSNGARLILIGGEPLGEQIIMWWNFVARSHEEIVQARADWQAQLSIHGVDDVTPMDHPTPSKSHEPVLEADRFGLPEHEPEPPLPAPPLPVAKLLPRG